MTSINKEKKTFYFLVKICIVFFSSYYSMNLWFGLWMLNISDWYSGDIEREVGSYKRKHCSIRHYCNFCYCYDTITIFFFNGNICNCEYRLSDSLKNVFKINRFGVLLSREMCTKRNENWFFQINIHYVYSGDPTLDYYLSAHCSK